MSRNSLPVIIIGTSGHARVVQDVLYLSSRTILGATGMSPITSRLGEVPILGEDLAVQQYPPDTVELVNGVGSVHRPTARHSVYTRFKAMGYTFATIVHPSAIIADGVTLGEGAQIMAGVVIQPGTSVGENTIINTRASIDHDCVIGSHVHIAPGVTCSGNVSIGDQTHVGTGASVLHQIRIGASVVVGGGAVVVHDIADGELVYGVPARRRMPSP